MSWIPPNRRVEENPPFNLRGPVSCASVRELHASYNLMNTEVRPEEVPPVRIVATFEDVRYRTCSRIAKSPGFHACAIT
jgi:hypothetical protein